MKFITLLIALSSTVGIDNNTKFKDENRFDNFFEKRYFQVEQIDAIDEELTVKVYSAYEKQYATEYLCRVHLNGVDSVNYGVVRQDCDTLVKELNGEH